MTKKQFLSSLERRLSVLPRGDVKERVSFYSDMIDDKIEEGLCEEEAVRSVGPIEKIVSELVNDIPILDLMKKKMKPKSRLSGLELALIIAGFPLWVSLLAVAFAVFVSVYAVIWSMVLSLWAVFVSLAAASIAVSICGIILLFSETSLTGILFIGTAVICAGLGIYSFIGCIYTSRGAVWLSKQCIFLVKRIFVGRYN